MWYLLTRNIVCVCVYVYVHVGEIPLFHAENYGECDDISVGVTGMKPHLLVRGVEIAFPGSFSTVGT